MKNDKNINEKINLSKVLEKVNETMRKGFNKVNETSDKMNETPKGTSAGEIRARFEKISQSILLEDEIERTKERNKQLAEEYKKMKDYKVSEDEEFKDLEFTHVNEYIEEMELREKEYQEECNRKRLASEASLKDLKDAKLLPLITGSISNPNRMVEEALRIIPTLDGPVHQKALDYLIESVIYEGNEFNPKEFIILATYPWDDLN